MSPEKIRIKLHRSIPFQHRNVYVTQLEKVLTMVKASSRFHLFSTQFYAAIDVCNRFIQVTFLEVCVAPQVVRPCKLRIQPKHATNVH